MQILRLGSAIRAHGVEDRPGRTAQLALALATAAVPRLRRWMRAKTELDADIARAEAELEDLRSTESGEGGRIEEERDSREEELLRLRAEVRHIEDRPWALARPLWIYLFGRSWRYQRDAARKTLARKEQMLRDLVEGRSERVAALESSLEDMGRRRSELEPVPHVIEGLRLLDCVLVSREFQGSEDEENLGARPQWLIADPLGEPTAVLGAEIRMDRDALERLDADLDELRLDHIVLGPDSTSSLDGAPALFGGERDLVDVARRLAQFAASTEERRLDVPILDPDTPTARYVRELVDAVADHEVVPAELDRRSAARLEDVSARATELSELIESGLGPRASQGRALGEATEKLRAMAEAARESRGHAAHAIDRSLSHERANALLARYRLYCPECNRCPDYMAATYAFEHGDVEALSTDRLRQTLGRYLSARLETGLGRPIRSVSAKEMALRGRWDSTFAELDRLGEEAERYQAELRELDAGPAFTSADRLRKSSLHRQIEVRAARFSRIVRDLLTQPLALPDDTVAETPDDLARELDEQNRIMATRPGEATRLRYDPGAPEPRWTCTECECRFDTETAFLGAADPIAQDVLYPMIQGLWNHDSLRDEALEAIASADRSLKEHARAAAAAARERIDEFRSGADTLKARVEEAHARGRFVTQHLVNVAEQFERFGLLPPEELERVRETAGTTAQGMGSIMAALARLAAAEEDMARTVRELADARVRPRSPANDFVDGRVPRPRVEFATPTVDTALQPDTAAEAAPDVDAAVHDAEAPADAPEPPEEGSSAVPRGPLSTFPRREGGDEAVKRTHGALGTMPPSQGGSDR